MASGVCFVDSTKTIMTHCCHGTLYQDCVFSCRLWQYTRTYRRHYIYDGEFYNIEGTIHNHLWEISSTCGSYVHPPNRDGYDLYHKGKLIKHAKTVKELKIHVTELSPKQQS